eukprot:COSAG02_NODE_3177_length_7225_cov_253.074797_5_plen_629_part_00
MAGRPMPLPPGNVPVPNSGDGSDSDDDDALPLVLDAGGLCWRIGFAGDDAPARWTDDLPPQIILPVLTEPAAAGEDRGPEVAELAIACAAAVAALPADWDSLPDPLCLEEQTRRTGHECRAFGSELVKLAQQGAIGAKQALWRCNCALLQAFLRLNWRSLPMQMQIIVALPCLHDPVCSTLIDKMKRIVFCPDGPVKKAGRRCVRMAVQPRELLALYSTGRTTGLSVHVTGAGVSCYGVFEGFVLPECARRRDGDGEVNADMVATLVADAIFSAPLDCRMDLITNIIFSGDDGLLDDCTGLADDCQGRAILTTISEALNAEADRRLACALGPKVPTWRHNHWHREGKEGTFYLDHDPQLIDVSSNSSSVRKRLRVVIPPERKFSVWIGGSIVGCIDRGSRTCAFVAEGRLSGIFVDEATGNIVPNVGDGHGYYEWMADPMVLPCLEASLEAAQQRLAWARCFGAAHAAECPTLAITQLVSSLPLELAVAIGHDHRTAEMAHTTFRARLCDSDVKVADEELVAQTYNPARSWVTEEAQRRAVRTPADPPDSHDTAAELQTLEARAERSGGGAPPLGFDYGNITWLEEWFLMARQQGTDERNKSEPPASIAAAAEEKFPLRCVVWLLHGR